MSVLRGSTTLAMLLFVQAKEGRVEGAEMRKTAHAIAHSPNAGNTALKRLIDRGHIVVEYRITPDGQQALQRAMNR